MDDTQWWTRKSASYNLVHWVQWVNIIFVYLIFYFGPNLFCSGLKIFGLDQKNLDLIKIFWTWTTPNDELEKVRHNLVHSYTMGWYSLFGGPNLFWAGPKMFWLDHFWTGSKKILDMDDTQWWTRKSGSYNLVVNLGCDTFGNPIFTMSKISESFWFYYCWKIKI